MGVHPPPAPAWANFTLMMECMPESSRYYSVYSVVLNVNSNLIGCPLLVVNLLIGPPGKMPYDAVLPSSLLRSRLRGICA